MARIPTVVLMLLGLARGADPAQAGDPGVAATRLSAASIDSLQRETTRARSEAQSWLRSSPTSYLAAVARADFGDRAALVVGSGASADLRLDPLEAREAHLRVEVRGDSFQVTSLGAGAGFQVGGSERLDAVLPPGNLRLGRYTLRLSHQRFPAIIAFDPNSPRLAGEAVVMRWFDHDPRYRFEVALEPDSEPDTVIVHSTRGHERRALRMGWFSVRMPGGRARLEAHRLLEPGVGESSVSVFFRDATTGRSTYDVGRYLEPEALADGRWRLDFNSAYNPACAYSPHYNCPIPSRANTLKIAVRAGELKPLGVTGAH